MSSRTGEPERALADKQRVETGPEALRVGITPYVAEHMRDRHGPNRRYAHHACVPSSAVDGAGVVGSREIPFETAENPRSWTLDPVPRPPRAGNYRTHRVDRRDA